MQSKPQLLIKFNSISIRSWSINISEAGAGREVGGHGVGGHEVGGHEVGGREVSDVKNGVKCGREVGKLPQNGHEVSNF